MDADGLWRKLIEAHPGLEKFRASVRLAKNSDMSGAMRDSLRRMKWP